MGASLSDDSCEIHSVDAAAVARVRPRLGEVDGLADTFKVLADDTRVKILHALSLAELCVCDLASLLGLSESAVSHQLRLLRLHRLVKYRKAGKMAFYSLDDDHVVQLLAQATEHVREVHG